jgi:hypothetical protein
MDANSTASPDSGQLLVSDPQVDCVALDLQKVSYLGCGVERSGLVHGISGHTRLYRHRCNSRVSIIVTVAIPMFSSTALVSSSLTGRITRLDTRRPKLLILCRRQG